jgi:hypothetical protein
LVVGRAKGNEIDIYWGKRLDIWAMVTQVSDVAHGPHFSCTCDVGYWILRTFFKKLPELLMVGLSEYSFQMARTFKFNSFPYMVYILSC